MSKELFEEFEKSDVLMSKIFSFLVDADEISYVDAMSLFSIMDLTHDNLTDLGNKYTQELIKRREKNKKHRKINSIIMKLIMVCNIVGVLFLQPIPIFIAILLRIVIGVRNSKNAKDNTINYDEYEKLVGLGEGFTNIMDNCITFINKKIKYDSYELSKEVSELLKGFEGISVETFIFDANHVDELIEEFEKVSGNSDDIENVEIAIQVFNSADEKAQKSKAANAEKEEEMTLKLVKKDKK